MGFCLSISNKDLWVKKSDKKRVYRHLRPSYNNINGRSIEDRDKVIEKRDEYGHWEMDTVVGSGRYALLVLTERKSRQERILKIKSKSKKEVIKELDKIEKKIGTKEFRVQFKTITMDNGGEFLSQVGIEQSAINKRIKRTAAYYCHPYSAWERGSNENANKLIRRFIPKGADIKNYTNKEIAKIEHYMNNYPRKILGGCTPKNDRIEQNKLIL